MMEEVRMWSMKTSSVLIRSRDMTEKQRLLWLMPMTVCAEVNRVMQELTNVNYNSEQNNKMTKARKLCDTNDTDTILSALNDTNPFDDHHVLMNIIWHKFPHCCKCRWCQDNGLPMIIHYMMNQLVTKCLQAEWSSNNICNKVISQDWTRANFSRPTTIPTIPRPSFI